MRLNRLIKNTLAILLPVLLAALVVIQLQMCKNILNRRNVYILERLPATSEKVWDALSGSLFPYIYSSSLDKDNPTGVDSMDVHLKNRPLISSHGDNFQISNEKWLQGSQSFAKQYRVSVLQSGLPSLTVHYLWCVDGYFEISQYISILSILHQFRPDKIVIHYRIKPRIDPNGYWRWLEDLERDVIMLSLKPLSDAKLCRHGLSSGVTSKDFPDSYGIFILGDVVITNLTRPDIVNFIAHSFSKKESEISLLDKDRLSQSQVFIVPETDPFHVSQSPGRVVISCPTESDFNSVHKSSLEYCVSMQSYISPDFLIHMESRFYNLVRSLIYGSPKPITVSMASSVQIPNIIHIVLGEENIEVSPLLYLSIKSAYHSGKVDTVFVHCHNKPSGELWERLFYSDHLEPKWIPTSLLKKPSSKHAVKIYLLYTLLQHGGVGTLGDSIFTKSVSSMPLKASAIVSPQKSKFRQRHRSLNTDILVAAPGSDFIRDILGMIYQSQQPDTERDVNDIASHISEINPKSVLIDSFLTSNQFCQGERCMIASGHDSPDMTYTTRLMWHDSEQPKNLRELLSIEGPLRGYFSSLM